MANNSHKPFSQLLSIVVAWNIFPFQKSNRIFIIGPKCRTSRTQPCLGAMLFEIKSLHPWPIWKTEMKNKVDCCNTFWDIVHRGTLTHTDMGITISPAQKSGRGWMKRGNNEVASPCIYYCEWVLVSHILYLRHFGVGRDDFMSGAVLGDVHSQEMRNKINGWIKFGKMTLTLLLTLGDVAEISTESRLRGTCVSRTSSAVALTWIDVARGVLFLESESPKYRESRDSDWPLRRSVNRKYGITCKASGSLSPWLRSFSDQSDEKIIRLMPSWLKQHIGRY